MQYYNKTYLVKRHSSYPLIKFLLTQDIREKYDITHEMMANCAVTFSMYNEETDTYKIANVAGDLLIIENEYQFLDEPNYALQYFFKSKDTNEVGVFKGEFKLTFLGEHCGIITLPASDPLQIIVQESITKIDLATELTLPISNPASSIPPYFYGRFASGGVGTGQNRPAATESLVKSGTQVNNISTGTIIVDFNSTGDDYIFFAVPITSSLKTKWYVNSLNQGDIQGIVAPSGNLFPDPVVININITNPLLGIIQYRVYISNYQTEALSPIEFRNS
jgi:hypothetical protein